MPSTPKNPLDGSAQDGAPNRTIAPRVPPYDGGQFARDSMTPEEIGVRRDQYWNEIPMDRPSHDNTTPEHSNPLYVGRQFDTLVTSPTGGGYGVMVEDKGQTPSKTSVNVNIHRADRGPEN
jgi:hypothetical protein